MLESSSAECNILRMEHEVALRELDCHGGYMEAPITVSPVSRISCAVRLRGHREIVSRGSTHRPADGWLSSFLGSTDGHLCL